MSAPKILIVVTSHAKLGTTGKPTGFWLEELAVPYRVFAEAGAVIDIASPRGGRPPTDPRSEADPGAEVRAFLADPAAAHKLAHTLELGAVCERYDAVFIAGGHGVMWDLTESPALDALLARTHEAGGVIAAVCHGPAALVGARRPDGRPLVDGHRVTGFSNQEEVAAGLQQIVPFLLETRLGELGAIYERGPMWQSFALRDRRVVTGQNPASSAAAARETLAALRATARPPQIAAPTGARPVTVTLRLSAKDPAAFREHLRAVLPVTRLAAGCRYSHTYEDPEHPGELVLIQGWDCTAQHQAYIAWREIRGDLATFAGFLARPATVETFELIDG